jgi:LysM repeat protein
MAPFVERIDGFRAEAIASAVSTVAKTVIDRASYTGDFTQADTTLKGLGATYGVDTSGYQLQLGTILNQQVNASIAAGQGVPAEASLLPASEFKVPDVSTDLNPTPSAPVPPTAPGTPTASATPAPAAAKPDYESKSGDTLGAIAARSGMSLTQLLDLNPEYKSNPNALQIGAKIKLSAPSTTTPAPTATPVASPVSPTPLPSTVQKNKPSQALTDLSIANSPKQKAPSQSEQKRLDAMKKQLDKLKPQVEELTRRNQSTQGGTIK